MKKSKWEIGYVPIDCCACGQRFGVQQSFYDAVVLRGRDFTCPGGHNLVNTKAFAEKQERERLEQEKKEQATKTLEKKVDRTLWDKIWDVLSHRLFGA